MLFPYAWTAVPITSLSQDTSFVFEEAEQRFDLVFSVLRTGRSLAAAYNLQSDIQREFFACHICSISDAVHSIHSCQHK